MAIAHRRVVDGERIYFAALIHALPGSCLSNAEFLDVKLEQQEHNFFFFFFLGISITLYQIEPLF